MDITLFFDESESKTAQTITLGTPIPHQPALGGLTSLFHLSGTIAVPQLGASLSWWVHRGSTRMCVAAISHSASADAYFPLPMVTVAADQQIITCGLTRVTPNDYVLVWLDTTLQLTCLPLVLVESAVHNGALTLEADEGRKISRSLLHALGDNAGNDDSSPGGSGSIFKDGRGVTCAAVISVSRDPSKIVTSVFVSDGYDILLLDVIDGEDQLELVSFVPNELAPYTSSTKGGLTSFLPWGRTTRSQQWVALSPLQMTDGLVLAHVSGKVVVLSGSKGPAAAAHASCIEVPIPESSFSHQLSVSATAGNHGQILICTDAALPGTHVVTALSVQPGEAPQVEQVLESPTPGSVPFGHAVVAAAAAGGEGCTLSVVWLAEDVEIRPVTVASLLHCTPRSDAAATLQVVGAGAGPKLFISSTSRLDCLLAVNNTFVLVESVSGRSRLYALDYSPLRNPQGDKTPSSISRLLAAETIALPDTKETCARETFLARTATLIPLANEQIDVDHCAGAAAFAVGVQIVGAAVDGASVLGQLILDTAEASADAASHHAYLELTSTAKANGFRCPYTAFSEDDIANAIALALQPMQPRTTEHPHSFAMQSRRYIYEQVAKEICGRIAFLVVTQLAVVYADPTAPLQPFFRDLRIALDLLSASLLTVHQLQSHLPLVVTDLKLETAVEDCFSVFVNPSAVANLSQHVIVVATEHLSAALPGLTQVAAKRAWGNSLRERCPLACHMLIECNIAAARTNRSAHIEALSTQVALYLARNFSSADPWLTLFSSVFPREVLDELRNVGSTRTDLLPRLYRVALLRQLMPTDTATKQLLISSHSIEGYFLPDLLLVLPVVESLGAANLHIHLTRLLIDVYLLIGRSAADSRQYSLACRHAVAARQLKAGCPALSALNIIDRQISQLASRVVEVATISRQGQSLVDLPVKDPTVVKLLANKLFQLVTRSSTSGLHKPGSSSSSSGQTDRLHGTMLLLQFLSRRRAFGLAARVAMDVAQLMRFSSQGSSTSLEAVEQLVAMAHLFLRSIPDVVPHDDLDFAEDTGDLLGGGLEQGTTDSSTSVRFATRTDSLVASSSKPLSATPQPSSGGTAALSLFSKEPMSRAYIPRVSLRLRQSRCERVLAAASQPIDPSKHVWTEFAELEKATHETIRKELVMTLQWALAEDWAVTTGQDVAYVFEAEAMNLQQYGESATSSWALLIERLLKHSTVANNFAPINKVVRSCLVNGNYKKVPYALKDALKACDPAGLISAILSAKRIIDEGTTEKKLPQSLQEEAIRVALDYLTLVERRDPSIAGIVIPFSLLDRVADVAKKITQNKSADGLPISELSQKLLQKMRPDSTKVRALQ